MVPCANEVLKTSRWQGLPRRTAETLCPQQMDKVHAPQWLKAGRGPPNSTSEAGQLNLQGQAPIASCAHPECSPGGGFMHLKTVNLKVCWLQDGPVSSLFGPRADLVNFGIFGIFGDGLSQAILFGQDARNVVNFLRHRFFTRFIETKAFL